MRTDGHEATSRFSQFCERACKLGTSRSEFASQSSPVVGQTPACSSPTHHTRFEENTEPYRSKFLSDRKYSVLSFHHRYGRTSQPPEVCVTRTIRQQVARLTASSLTVKFTGLLTLLSSRSSSKFCCCVMCIKYLIVSSKLISFLACRALSGYFYGNRIHAVI